ncbi:MULTISPECIES: hypothetical protein [Frankia]|uniref:hypothetical protein n=1 Tax=Frankia TaxID=1854 RepID=UPI00187DAABD|nr:MULTISPECIES: hypothetical protein [Frankia]
MSPRPGPLGGPSWPRVAVSVGAAGVVPTGAPGAVPGAGRTVVAVAVDAVPARSERAVARPRIFAPTPAGLARAAGLAVP